MDYTERATQLHFSSDPDYEYTIKAKRKFKEDYGRFSMVGVLRKKTTRKKYQDIFDRLVSVSKSAAIIFNQIKLNTDPETGIAVMSEFETLNDSQRRATNRRLVELKNVDIVLKIRTIKGLFIPKEKYSYMINPHLMKPWKYDDAKKLWKALKFPVD